MAGSAVRSRLYSQCAREGWGVWVRVIGLCITNFYHLTPVATICDQIVETLSLYGVTSENKTTTPIAPPLHSKLGCLLFRLSLKSGKTLHGGDGKGKLYFALLKLAKCQKGPLGQSISTNFVTDVANYSNASIHPFC